MEHLSFFRDYRIQKYGKPLQRIPFDLGLSCPNRAADGSGGCVFCSLSGSRARHLHKGMDMDEQAKKGLEYAKNRYAATPPYIAYFQAYTSTNADAGTLERLYNKALESADYRVVVIGTRPDCIGDDVLELLKKINQKHELWIELGIQTFNDTTLKKIKRGHDAATSIDCVHRLADAKINVAAHMMLGLPGESENDMLESAKILAGLPVSGVKYHNLLVLKGTQLASMKGVKTLDEYSYAGILSKCLCLLPENMLIMRLTSEAPEDEIIAPKWWMKKGQFLEFFKDYHLNGKLANGRFLPVQTNDGTYTLYHPVYRQHFHSIAGAEEESLKKYIEPAELEKKLAATLEEINLLDVGFGLGCNAKAAIQCAQKIGKATLEITSLELDEKVIASALTLPGNENSKLLEDLKNKKNHQCDFAGITLLTGDARKSVLSLNDNTFDIIFLDGFSPDVNPELWTLDFIAQLKRILKPDGIITTYSCAYPLIGALLKLNFNVATSIPFGRRHGGTVASQKEITHLEKISEKDRNIATLSTAGIPYRDKDLDANKDTILANHKEEIRQSRAAGMPKWFKG